jgi:hypothetical protein
MSDALLGGLDILCNNTLISNSAKGIDAVFDVWWRGGVDEVNSEGM